MVGDGAGFHHKGSDNALPENIKIIILPAYCPELNPAKKLWDIIKDRICNKDWEDLDELEDAITKRIEPCWEEPLRVMNLIGSSFLTTELNVINRIKLIHFNCEICISCCLAVIFCNFLQTCNLLVYSRMLFFVGVFEAGMI